MGTYIEVALPPHTSVREIHSNYPFILFHFFKACRTEIWKLSRYLYCY